MTMIDQRHDTQTGTEPVRGTAQDGAGAADAVTYPAAVGVPAALAEWVATIAAHTRPDRVVWWTGTPAEVTALQDELVAEGKLIRLNPELRPDSFLARSNPDDVARVESRTFICSENPADAGPTNNWHEPAAMRAELSARFAGSMRGRTMFVVPFSMGPVGGPLSRVGVQLTDSGYATLSMTIMTRTGSAVLDEIERGADWVRAIHSVGAPLLPGEADVAWPCNPEKYIVQFPETREIWSFGSGYGGNALLAKKCFALRIASVQGRDEGWLAEHMLLMRLISPEGRAFHIAGAFPSACGKTNLAMLRPDLPGWRVETLGDDIAWLQPREDGRLWAINPEAGFFGVAPGTNAKTNRAAIEMLAAHTIFTNVALTAEGDVWWEGLTDVPPAGLFDWQGNPWDPSTGTPAAHPNARFTVAAEHCPTAAENIGEAVPVDAILFGGRRASTVPLVTEARGWAHGVYLGATIASETTAAAEGATGIVRRDPFAMLPFCGYHVADHWAHWLRIGEQLDPDLAPRMYRVNWFRRDAEGGFLWPGFTENARVLAWIAGRITGEAEANETAIGAVPLAADIAADGLDADRLSRLLTVDPVEWRYEVEREAEFFGGVGNRLPLELSGQLAEARIRIARAFG
ncbi:phosphoenolpyruvate carboxykinase (GTP) [Mycetocola sp. BIGb0189]|uniref:phosphoenolpyruvate carboxykinase (GTP) n=1 Tax=Mycetocola sp. BIGb0189 TaxID=2940604 RepID=UPI00216A4536|nr:phosphoenolpyruvate carboxykinase (GTP) [Mycetocola sp. BIGb0189]MCS4276868.1 phosphoenolpyruvate carboxykinase (GTP) [Mycetocola sp. BIGb0189]